MASCSFSRVSFFYENPLNDKFPVKSIFPTTYSDQKNLANFASLCIANFLGEMYFRKLLSKILVVDGHFRQLPWKALFQEIDKISKKSFSWVGSKEPASAKA
jgi:hypothetical protein